MRNVMTRVFPLPAPARISTGPSVVSTASRCCGFNSSIYDKREWLQNALDEFYRTTNRAEIRTLDSKSTRGNRIKKQSDQGGRGKRLEANPKAAPRSTNRVLKNAQFPLKGAKFGEPGKVALVRGDHRHAHSRGAHRNQRIVCQTSPPDLFVAISSRQARQYSSGLSPVTEGRNQNPFDPVEVALHSFQ